MSENNLDIYLAEPRGFCAGVRRAISIVEEALEKFGAPVYVRHEIVHNKVVLEYLRSKGVIFIDDLDEAHPERPVIFSAHGVGLEIIEEANRRKLNVLDATCPLVAKVHKQISRLEECGAEIIVIGKKNHPEIIGTIGQLKNPEKAIVICSVEEAKNINLPKDTKIGFVTQTTLSVDDTAEIIKVLKQKFDNLMSMSQSDICFATTNRQGAVKALAQKTPNIVIIGSANSSNSKQLKETALKNGAQKAFLIDRANELDFDEIKGSVGISAGASAPEELVEELLQELQKHYDKINIHPVCFVKENANFKI